MTTDDETEPVVSTCCRCGKPVTSHWMKDGTGCVSKPEYVLVADWVMHADCYDEMVEGGLNV